MAYKKLGERLSNYFGEIEQRTFKNRSGRKANHVKLSDVAKSLGVEPVFLLANFYQLCPTFKKSGNFLFVNFDGQNEDDYSIGSFCHLSKQLGSSGTLNKFDNAVATGDYSEIQINFLDNIWIRSSLAVRMYPKKVYRLQREE